MNSKEKEQDTSKRIQSQVSIDINIQLAEKFNRATQEKKPKSSSVEKPLVAKFEETKKTKKEAQELQKVENIPTVSKMEFGVGDLVIFTTPKKETLTGTVVHVKPKKVIIKATDGEEWDILREFIKKGQS